MSTKNNETISITNEMEKKLIIDKKFGTSQDDNYPIYKEINYKFGNYNVKILIDDIGRFIGIKEIRMSKFFVQSQDLNSVESAEDIIEKYLKEQEK